MDIKKSYKCNEIIEDSENSIVVSRPNNLKHEMTYSGNKQRSIKIEEGWEVDLLIW